jgi:hypothetical protein
MYSCVFLTPTVGEIAWCRAWVYRKRLEADQRIPYSACQLTATDTTDKQLVVNGMNYDEKQKFVADAQTARIFKEIDFETHSNQYRDSKAGFRFTPYAVGTTKNDGRALVSYRFVEKDEETTEITDLVASVVEFFEFYDVWKTTGTTLIKPFAGVIETKTPTETKPAIPPPPIVTEILEEVVVYWEPQEATPQT